MRIDHTKKVTPWKRYNKITKKATRIASGGSETEAVGGRVAMNSR